MQGRKLKGRLQCRDIDVAGDFNFGEPDRYTATISFRGWMGGMLVSDVRTELIGERIGACQQCCSIWPAGKALLQPGRGRLDAGPPTLKI